MSLVGPIECRELSDAGVHEQHVDGTVTAFDVIDKRLGRLRVGLIGNDDFYAGQSGLAASTVLALEPVTITFAPSEWNRRAVAAPMPVVPPVIRTILSLSLMLISHR